MVNKIIKQSLFSKLPSVSKSRTSQEYFVINGAFIHSYNCSKEQDEELNRLRIELNALREQENNLEQKVESGKTQLEQLSKSHKDVLLQVNQVRLLCLFS